MSTVSSSPAALKLSEESQDLICSYVTGFSDEGESLHLLSSHNGS